MSLLPPLSPALLLSHAVSPVPIRLHAYIPHAPPPYLHVSVRTCPCADTHSFIVCAHGARVLVRTLRPLVGVACEADQLVFRAAASGGAVFGDQ